MTPSLTLLNDHTLITRQPVPHPIDQPVRGTEDTSAQKNPNPILMSRSVQRPKTDHRRQIFYVPILRYSRVIGKPTSTHTDFNPIPGSPNPPETEKETPDEKK